MAEPDSLTETKAPIGSSIGEDDIIQIVGMHKWFGEFHVLKNINLNVKMQERIVVCGPSGSGKSTLIRCINRLEEHQQGQIVVNGIELTNDHLPLLFFFISCFSMSRYSLWLEKKLHTGH